jgi:hypothetical protein
MRNAGNSNGYNKKIHELAEGMIIYYTIRPYNNFLIKRINTMGNLLYVIAVILVISWAIGFFGYHAGGIIHVLLVIAIIAFLLKVVRRA